MSTSLNPESSIPEQLSASHSPQSNPTQVMGPVRERIPDLTSVTKVKQLHGSNIESMAAILGLSFGGGLSALCFVAAPKGSVVSRMFDLRDIQTVVPFSIISVFIWGLLICVSRWMQLRLEEKTASAEQTLASAKIVAEFGPSGLAEALASSDLTFNPLLRRLQAVVEQWILNPGLIEADLILQQHVLDDEESVRRGYSLVRTFVWALPVLGLIGTVLGIAFAVGGFASFLGGRVDDVEAIKKSLVGVTGGLSFAFLLTLLGLATSLVLMLLASALETREERLLQEIQRRIVSIFLPALQRANPTDRSPVDQQTAPLEHLKTVAEGVLNHVADLASSHVSTMTAVLRGQQEQASAWGHGLHDQVMIAAKLLETTLNETAIRQRESGNELLARLDLIRDSWRVQADHLESQLHNQVDSNATLVKHLREAVADQSLACQSIVLTMESLGNPLIATTRAISALEHGVNRLIESPLERVITSLCQALQTANEESRRISQSLEEWSSGTRKTAELQVSVQDAVTQLHDLEIVATLSSVRDALIRHAGMVDKLNSGFTIKLSE